MPKLSLRRRPKRPDSAGLARPRKLVVVHGGGSAVLMNAALDGRSRLAKAYQQHVAALTQHVGGEPSIAQRVLISQAARLNLLGQVAWSEIAQRGAFADGMPAPALDAFRKAAADERSVLALLGIEARGKRLPSLSEYLGNGGVHAD